VTAARSFPPLPPSPLVSIVIPVRNEEAFMEACIASLRGLDYPADRLEIVFADGRSTDRTAELARRHGLRVVDNPGLKISAGRNAGFAASRGQVVAFSDADCTFDPAWVRAAVARLASGEYGGVSGPTRVPPGQDAFGQAVGIVFGWAGMAGGTVHFDRLAAAREADDLPGCNAFYRREALELVMPTNTNLFSNEDVEMNAELRARGVRLLLAPDVSVLHWKRSDPRRFWKQMFVFAIGRLQLGKRHPRFLRPCHWAIGLGFPAAALGFLALAVLRPAWAAGLAAAAVAAACALWAVWAVRRGPSVAGNLLLAVAIFAAAWPLGFLRELLFPLRPGYTPERKPV
jgi:glycosyltransferase involved in cell wall biosynthesis